MLKRYYFNNDVDNHYRHEVHTEDCSYLPLDRTYIGYFDNCKDAISKAEQQYPQKAFDGCFFCCRECHKG